MIDIPDFGFCPEFTCLVVGFADTVEDDLRNYLRSKKRIDFVIAVNDAIPFCPLPLGAAVSLHSDRYEDWGWPEKNKGWRRLRSEAGRNDPRFWFGHLECWADETRARNQPDYAIPTDYRFDPESKAGSSGLFATKVALIDFGIRNVVLCGVPITQTPHLGREENWLESGIEGIRDSWRCIPDVYKPMIKSMSGWTMTEFGSPLGDAKCSK